MEYGNELFQRTFSHLRASPRLREELLAMTEQKTNERKPKRYVARRLLVTAMVLALAFALAMGANAATDGELYEATIGKLVGYAIDGYGNRANVYKAEGSSGNVYIVEEEGDFGPKSEDDFEEGRLKKIVITGDENGSEIGVEKDGEELTRPVEELMEGTGEIVSLPTEDGGSTLLNIPWLYDPETGIDGYRQRADGRYDVVVRDISGELKIIVTDELPFFIHGSASHE